MENIYDDLQPGNIVTALIEGKRRLVTFLNFNPLGLSVEFYLNNNIHYKVVDKVDDAAISILCGLLLKVDQRIFSISTFEDSGVSFQIFEFDQNFSICQLQEGSDKYMLWDKETELPKDNRVLTKWHEVQNLYREKTGIELKIPVEVFHLGLLNSINKELVF